jgi:hypothetical protein
MEDAAYLAWQQKAQRISTSQLSEFMRKLQATDPDSADPDSAEPDSAEPDSAEPDSAEPGSAEPGSAEPLIDERAADEPQSCAICCDALIDPRMTPCLHVFCCACIKRALWIKKCCPTCRAPVRSHRELCEDVPPASAVRGAASACGEAQRRQFAKRQLAAGRQLGEHEPTATAREAYADEVVGRRVTLWWHAEEQWFQGTVANFVRARRMHLVRCVRRRSPLETRTPPPLPPYPRTLPRSCLAPSRIDQAPCRTW